MSRPSLSLGEPLYSYLLSITMREDTVLAECRQKSLKMSTAGMLIAPEQGQFLSVLVKMLQPKKALEIGVFTGYSSTIIARALPEDGHLIACDKNVEWTKTARATWEQAGVTDKITLHLADAAQTLDTLFNEHDHNSFDFAFIDANKKRYLHYYETVLQLLKPGGVMVFDNTLWNGDVADQSVVDTTTQRIREFNEFLQQDERIDLSVVPIGDGMTMCLKRT